MQKHTVTAHAAMVAVVAAALCGCAGGEPAAHDSSLFSQVGGQNVRNMAGDIVHKSIADPRLASLHSKDVDAAASSGRVSNQLCSMLGGHCPAPLTESQVAAGADRLTPEQSQAITEHFDSSLTRASPDPAVRDRIRQALAGQVPGVVGGIL